MPEPPIAGRIIVLACGKAASEMGRIVELHYEAAGALSAVTGLAVTKYGYGHPLEVLRLIEANHPIPDLASQVAAQEAIALASSATKDDLVLCLISGGSSALWAAPAGNIILAEKQKLTRRLMRSSARTHEINCVRKHISKIKGGRLATYAAAASLVTLAMSDITGDEPQAIGSGPTCADPTTLAQAREVLADHRINVPASVAAHLDDLANETPKPGDLVFENSRYELIVTGRNSLDAAGELARGLGYDVIMLGDSLEGEARQVAQSHANLAQRCLAEGRRAVILSGGELTVTARGDGRGAPNQEYALALAMALKGQQGIAAIAADTDGADGGCGAVSDPAGAIIDAGTLQRAASLHLVPATFLENNDSTGFFRQTNDLLVCGPTGTNVNDFRAIVVDSSIGV